MDERELIPACVLCGGLENERVTSKYGYTIVRCLSCGLVFVNPRASKREILRQYMADVTSPMEYYLRTERTDRYVFQKRLALVEKYFPVGRLLDVGSGVGTFLSVARERGWTADGIEAKPKSIRYCQSKGLSVKSGFFDEETLGGIHPDFDLVHIGDVIEHFRNPVEAVQLSRSLLRRGGMVIVTPNFESVVARLLQMKPLEHLFYFTERTLRRLLEENGFKVLLLLRTSRRRDMDSMIYGTTFKSPALKGVLKIASATGISRLLGRLHENFIRDDLVAIAGRVP